MRPKQKNFQAVFRWLLSEDLNLNEVSVVQYRQYKDQPSMSDIIVAYDLNGEIEEIFKNENYSDTIENMYFLNAMKNMGKTYYLYPFSPGDFFPIEQGIHLSYNPKTNFIYKNKPATDIASIFKESVNDSPRYLKVYIESTDTSWVLPQPDEEGNEEPIFRSVIVSVYDSLYFAGDYPDTNLRIKVEDKAELPTFDRHFYATQNRLKYAKKLTREKLYIRNLVTDQIDTITIFMPPEKELSLGDLYQTQGSRDHLVPIDIMNLESGEPITKGFVSRSDSSNIASLITPPKPLHKVVAVDKNDVPLDMWTTEETEETFTSDQKGEENSSKWSPGKISVLAAGVTGLVILSSLRP